MSRLLVAFSVVLIGLGGLLGAVKEASAWITAGPNEDTSVSTGTCADGLRVRINPSGGFAVVDFRIGASSTTTFVRSDSGAHFASSLSAGNIAGHENACGVSNAMVTASVEPSTGCSAYSCGTRIDVTYSATRESDGATITITIVISGPTGASNETPSATITNSVTPAPNSAPQAMSQQQIGATLVFQGTSQNISTGIGNAIAERFFDGGGNRFSVSGDGRFGSAYFSTAGLHTFVRDQRRARFEPIDRPILSGLDAFDEALVGQSTDPTQGSEEVSPYLLGTDVVPLVEGNPDVVRLNAWMRGTITHHDGDSFSGNTWSGVAGMDYLLTDNLLVGVLAGYENGDFDFNTTNGQFDGSGFTAGAYVGARLSQSIVADAFITHSWLNYDTRVGTATGSTDASRWLVSMNVTGSYDLTDTLILEPNVRVFYAHETQDGYTLSDTTMVAENSIDSGRLSLGPRLRYVVTEDWTAFLSAHGEYDLSSETQTNTTLPDFDGLLSARIGLGINGVFWNGWSLSLSGDVSGIGSGDHLAYTGTGSIRVPLN